MDRHRLLWPLLVTLALVAGCSADDDDQAEPPTSQRQPDPETSTTTTTTEAPAAPPRAMNTLDPPLANAAATNDPAVDELDDGRVPLGALQVGDCVDLPDLDGLAELDGPDGVEVVDATPRRCDEPHDAEAFARMSLNENPDAPFPGDEHVLAAADRKCLEAFGGYMGVGYVDSELEIVHIRPNAAAWTRGDRVLVCAAASVDSEPLVGSVAGSP
ncbi:MAG: septum formation family protein [Acidimicrobiales bacterium]|nr:septum formation family protein [Acidimicrobiales bacterium]